MKRIVFVVLSCFIVLWLSCSLEQALPDGATARLGKGRAYDAIFSPDGTMLVVASSIGVYIYDPVTIGEIHFFEMDKEAESVLFSSDSRLLAGVSSHLGIVKLWDVNGRKEFTTIDTDDSLNSVSLSPDGELLAMGGTKKFRLLDANSRKEIITIDGNCSAAFSPDGELLAIGSNGGLKVWDVKNRELVVVPSEHWEGSARSLQFSPDGSLLAGVSATGINGRDREEKIRLWDVKKRAIIANFPYEWYPPFCFSPDGKFLVIEGVNLNLWDVKSHKSAGTLTWSEEQMSDYYVSSASFSPDGKLLAAGSGSHLNGYQCPIKVWDVNSLKEICTLPGHGDRVDSVCFSPDGRLLVSVGEGTVKLWDVENRKLVSALSDFSEDIASISFSLDGSLLASAGGSQVKLWDVKSRAPVADLSGHSCEFVGSVCFSPDGKLLASAGGRFTTAILWDVNSHKKIAEFTGGDYSVCFSPDGSLLAAGGWEEVSVWDVKSREPFAILPGHSELVLSISFSPDGSLLASGGEGVIVLWDVRSGKEITTLPADGYVASLAFSPNGKLLAGGSDGKSVSGGTFVTTLWNVQNVKEITVVARLTPGGGSVCFSPDGRILATGGRLWDVESHKEIAEFSGGIPVCFNPDGSLLASGGPTGTILLWDVKPYLNKPSGIPVK